MGTNRKTLKPSSSQLPDSCVIYMSARKKKQRDRDAPMPAAGAGLIRFFQDESEGIKVGPIAVLITTVLIITFVLIAHVFLEGGIFFGIFFGG